MIGYIEAIDNSGPVCLLQVSVDDDETLDDIPYYQAYGISAVPEIGSEVVLAFLDETRTNTVALSAVNRDKRPEKISPNETCLFRDKEHYIHLKKDGATEVKTKNLSLNASGPVSGKAAKWAFSVGETELLQVMVSLVETLMSNTQVNTVYGTSPLLNPNTEKCFAKIVEKLNLLRGE